MTFHRRLITQSMLAVALALPIANPCSAQATASSAPRASISSYGPELRQLEQQADWAGIERLSRRALQTLETRLGPDTVDVAAAADWLATALQGQSRYGEAETFARRALAIHERMQGPQHPDTSASLNLLGQLLQVEGRYSEAEPYMRRALAIREQTLGATNLATSGLANNLAGLLQLQGRYGEAEPLARRALAVYEQQRPQDPDTADVAARLSRILTLEGRYGEAEPLARRALAIDEQTLGPQHMRTAANADILASVLAAEDRADEAETLERRALAIDERVLGPDHPNTNSALLNLGELIQNLGRPAEAEPLLRRALAGDRRHFGPDHPQTATDEEALAVLLRYQQRYAEAEPLFRHAITVAEESLAPEHPDRVYALSNLGNMLSTQRRDAEAEPLLRRALSLVEKIRGPDSVDTAAELSNLASMLDDAGRHSEAQPLILRAVVIAEKSLGPDHPNTATALQNAGINAIRQAHLLDAVVTLRLACATRSKLDRSRGESAATVAAARGQASTCARLLTLALWFFAEQGGASNAPNRPDAMKQEAFTTSQQALQSAAGDAMARSAALTAARAADVGPQAEAYEAALLERDELDKKFARAAGGADVARSDALAKARADAGATIERLASELRSKAPRYWDYRSPEPVSVAALQSRSGADAALLHDNEALILFFSVSNEAQGLVFAISKEQAGWALLGLTSAEIRERVTKLRAEIDPEAYALNQAPDGAGDTIPGVFDRQAAYELCLALLGNASIQAVIRDKPVLLFVPSGVLTTLPPGLLVTAPPAGGAAGNSDPEALRATPWLLRSKAVALLPTVSSLRTLRQILPASEAAAPDPLLVFADPDFTRPKATPRKRVASAAARGFSSFFRDGLPLAEALDGLPSLPGTRVEGEALERALGGRPGSLLMGREASKAELLARNSDGRLARVRVLEFATHGLVAGDASDLSEPALALAAGAKPQDELLLASEASTLKLRADWVLLSACNTASRDAPEAQGLSGLSRAFFYAGAKSLLVSHWRVRDDVAPRLIPAMVLAERQQANLSRAEALRQASLAILDDRSINAADPSAWAPFTLIGEAAR